MPTELTTTLATTLAAVVGLLTLVWLLSLILRDASIIDPFWGMGFVLVAFVSLCVNHPSNPRAWLLTLLTSVWAARLSTYLLVRNWGHGEDRRYRAMREHHGARFWWVSLLTVFLLQAVLLWFVSLPIQAAACLSESAWSWLDLVGCLLWAVGVSFEALGDWQLARFKSDPRNAGAVMDRGLWRYTRHPNYFGDFCVWWGIFLIAAAGGAWWTVLSPVLMSLLLLRVSGVTLLESSIGERRPAYREYQARTNAFFPGPPRPAAHRSVESRQPT